MKHGNVLPRAKMVDESFGENCTEAIFVGAVTTPMYSDDWNLTLTQKVYIKTEYKTALFITETKVGMLQK